MNDHGDQWWEDFWSNTRQHFGEPRQELIHTAETFREALQLDRPLTLVDAGSGNGRYALPFARAKFVTTAVEKSANGCKVIQRAARAAALELDIRQIDFLEFCKDAAKGEVERFDVVISSGLIEEVAREEQTDVITGLQDITKPGGLLIFKCCLEIKDRGVTVEDDFVMSFFQDDSQWKILRHDVEKAIRDSLAPIHFENRLRTETLVVRKSGSLA